MKNAHFSFNLNSLSGNYNEIHVVNTGTVTLFDMQGKKQTQITKNGTQTFTKQMLSHYVDKTHNINTCPFLNIMAIQQKYSGTSSALGFSHLLYDKTVGYFALYKI